MWLLNHDAIKVLKLIHASKMGHWYGKPIVMIRRAPANVDLETHTLIKKKSIYLYTTFILFEMNSANMVER